MVRNYRKPLIVIGPKVLLRHPSAVSAIDDMLPGTTFRPVLSDPAVRDAQKVTKVVFMTGKHFYAVDKERHARVVNNMAIIRLEASLCTLQRDLRHSYSSRLLAFFDLRDNHLGRDCCLLEWDFSSWNTIKDRIMCKFCQWLENARCYILHPVLYYGKLYVLHVY